MSNEKSESNIEQLQQQKNQWLFSQVDVDFPTRESVLGKACYLDLIEAENTIDAIELSKIEAQSAYAQLDWIKADFHKLTVLFSQFFAKHSQVPVASKEYLQEFFAQIILDEQAPHSLWLGFSGNEVAGVAIVSLSHDPLSQVGVLVSDLLLDDSLNSNAEISSILNIFSNQLAQIEHKQCIYVHKATCIK
ncbi:hypothetical protein VHA01S_019_00400 [Vibrio halioticoli NBRC 102217]|uniref:Uncharacterized protein n=1 Tax=Vibrio halioticoli NBRC 102217 TaxID=1219072 RepID=V5FCX6_9VIBR|nr:hypothetical protein [Vibrio halioticoli]GAD89363.1 hypothetical protein VHA01S_019_00400 [Vibrio halioticoli NBRC 102217]